jgi:hypothetical protein
LSEHESSLSYLIFTANFSTEIRTDKLSVDATTHNQSQLTASITGASKGAKIQSS